MTEWLEGEVTDIHHWTQTLFSLRVNAPISAFVAGQFTKLALEIEGQRVQRAYSFVNAPHDTQLEFYLVRVANGKLSQSLYQLQVGSKLQITRQAAGMFVVNQIPECETLWMLATGTAIGPYLSILQQGEGLQRFAKIVLVHAVRYGAELSYLPLMQQLTQRYPGQLQIATVTSRDQHPGSLHGRIPGLIEKGILQRHTGANIDAQHTHIMLCGNPEMVRDTQRLLQNQYGLRKHLLRNPGHISVEHYW
jgi:ferredoxin--NADP+ reductase